MRLGVAWPALVLAMAVLLLWHGRSGTDGARGHDNDYMSSYSRQLLKEDPLQIDSPNVTLSTIPARVWRMLGIRTASAATMLVNLPPETLEWSKPLEAAITLSVLLLVAIGLAKTALSQCSLLECYVLAYFGLLLLWPFDEGWRYLYPMAPFLLLYAAQGLQVMGDWLRTVALQWNIWGAAAPPLTGVPALERPLRHGVLFTMAEAALIVGVAVLGLRQDISLARGNLHPDPAASPKAPTVTAAAWILQHSRPGDVVMDEQFAILHRLTGRKTVRFPLLTDSRLLQAQIVADSVAFIVVLNEMQYEFITPSVMRRFAAVAQAYPGMFVPSYTFGQGTIYRVESAQPTVVEDGGQGPRQ